MKRLSFLFIFLSVISVFPNAFAFNDTKTHPKLTTFAFETSRTGKESYFQNHLFLKNGSDTIIVGNKLIDWIKHGAQMEDEPSCRASNNFQNPYLF